LQEFASVTNKFSSDGVISRRTLFNLNRVAALAELSGLGIA